MPQFQFIAQDCVPGLYELKPGSVDVVVTSPPYNIGKSYHTYQDNLSDDDYFNWTEIWGGAIADVLRPNGSFFLNLGASSVNPWFGYDVASVLRRMFKLQNVIHWVKSVSINGRTQGHYKPINSKRFVNNLHEYIFHFTKSGRVELDRLAIGVPYQDKSNIKRWGSAKRDLHCRGNVWYLPYETVQHFSDRPHPATFPVALPEYCFRLHGAKKIKRAVDPFVGLGASAIAFKRVVKAKRAEFIGFDIDPEYIEHAQRRVEGAT
jgi:site-specific DNA-methyltransferase (adenine-specific)